MADNHTESQRSINMAHIKSRDTKPEIIVRKYLFSEGFRFRIYDKRYPGHPDMVLPKYRTMVFVNGCFWHQHKGCRYATVPETNKEYWIPKLKKNKERDKKNVILNRKAGWHVITVWECQLMKDKRTKTLESINHKTRRNSSAS